MGNEGEEVNIRGDRSNRGLTKSGMRKEQMGMRGSKAETE
jgi:hypothetical protein